MNKIMKYTGNIKGFMPQLARGLRRNTTRQFKFKRPVFINDNRRRRRRNNQNYNGIEINHADGGFKQNYSKQQTRLVPINCYGRLVAVKDGTVMKYKIQLLSEMYAISSDNIDLRTELNRLGEFVEWRKFATQYRVKGVNTTINYNYHAGQGDYLPRLLLIYNTDTIQTTDFKFENNVMNLDLTKLGTKNYNLRLNRRNMSVNNVDWINYDTSYSGNINLLVSQQDFANFGNDETKILGTVKFTFNVIFRLRDIRVTIQNKICEKARGINEFERELDNSDVISESQIKNEIKEEEKEEKGEKKEYTTSESQCEIATSESGTQCSMYEGVALKPFCTEQINQRLTTIFKIIEKLKTQDSIMIGELVLKTLDEYDQFMKNAAIQFTKLINFLPNEDNGKGQIICGVKDFDKEFKDLLCLSQMDVKSIAESLRQSQARIMLHICSNGKKYFWSEKDELTFRDIVNKLLKLKIIETKRLFKRSIQRKKKHDKNKKNKKKKKDKKYNEKIKNDEENAE